MLDYVGNLQKLNFSLSSSLSFKTQIAGPWMVWNILWILFIQFSLLPLDEDQKGKKKALANKKKKIVEMIDGVPGNNSKGIGEIGTD